jgi:hypothetical protein
MDVRYEPLRSDEGPCPVCAGAGAWDTKTGAPVFTWPLPPGVQRCPFCEGTRRWIPKAQGVT